MRRQREDMQVNVAGLRRNIKNIAHNYSEAQIKVREATSNDPWGPNSTLMAEIADLTYNIVAFTEIMQMIWKRLNDHGKNWRHVYKSLVLLEYLIKTGSDKVASQCKENIFAIETLKDFQHLEESKDQGQNVREKAKQLIHLLKDDERLRNERARALKAKERFAQSASGFGSDGNWWGSGSGSDGGGGPSSPRGNSTVVREHAPAPGDLETARPHTQGEEELQLQLALAMSREEADQEAQRRRSDDVRLQLALSQSEEEFKSHRPSKDHQSHILDLLDVNLGSPVGGVGEGAQSIDPWGLPSSTVSQTVPAIPKKPDPWSVVASSTSTSPPPVIDPWSLRPASASTSPIPIGIGTTISTLSTTSVLPTSSKPSNVADPWRPVPAPAASQSLHDPWNPNVSPPPTLKTPLGDIDEFDIITNREKPPSLLANANSINNNNNNNNGISTDPFDFGLLGESLPSRIPSTSPSNNLGHLSSSSSPAMKKTPQSFLGENSSLVNLDNLVSAKPAVPQVSTPMALHQTPPQASAASLAANPFGGLRPGSASGMRGIDPVWGGPTTASSPPNPFLS